jgi:hypothetical protein
MTSPSAVIFWKVLSGFELSTVNYRLFSIHHPAEGFECLAGE